MPLETWKLWNLKKKAEFQTRLESYACFLQKLCFQEKIRKLNFPSYKVINSKKNTFAKKLAGMKCRQFPPVSFSQCAHSASQSLIPCEYLQWGLKRNFPTKNAKRPYRFLQSFPYLQGLSGFPMLSKQLSSPDGALFIFELRSDI